MKTMPKVNFIYAERLTGDQALKVVQVCNALGIHPNWLMGVMYFETGGTLSPAKTNGIGSVGLIQFTRDRAGVDYKTIAGERYYLSDIKQMSFVDQMDLVYLYLKPYANKIKAFIDLYLVVFFPVAIGKPLDYVLQTSGLSASKIAEQNPIFDPNRDKQIKKREIVDFFKGWYKDDFAKINVSNFGLLDWFKVVSGLCLVFFYTAYSLGEILNF
jgi:hypothetical protein